MDISTLLDVLAVDARTGAMSSCERPAGGDGRVPSRPRVDLAGHGEDRSPGKAAYYRGVADWWGRHVWVERDVVRGALSQHGGDPGVSYTWGRSGLGARELARSLLYDATGNAALSERHCRDFTHEILAHLPDPEFVLGREEILTWIAERPEEPSP